jgi:hypothetical protein
VDTEDEEKFLSAQGNHYKEIKQESSASPFEVTESARGRDDEREERVAPSIGKRVRNGLRRKCLCRCYRKRRRSAAQDEEARDDALGGFRTTVIAGLLLTLTIQIGAYDWDSGAVCSKLHTFQNNGELDRGLPLTKCYQVRAGRDGPAVNPGGGANSELRIIAGKGGHSEALLTSGIVSRV